MGKFVRLLPILVLVFLKVTFIDASHHESRSLSCADSNDYSESDIYEEYESDEESENDNDNDRIVAAKPPIKISTTSVSKKLTCKNSKSLAALLTKGNYDFSGKFLYSVVKSKPGSSAITSGFSVLTPLAELGLYSKGRTNAELLKILNLKNKEEIICVFPSFLDSVKSSVDTELLLGNKIYVSKSFKLSEPFKKDSRELFRAEGETIDFSKTKEAAEKINNWVSGATKGKIKQAIAPSMLNARTLLVLVNAIYFKGSWSKKFLKENTKKTNFYVDCKKIIKVDTMYQRNKFQYNEHSDIDAKTIAFPFNDDGNTTFVVILPNKNDGLLNLLDKLQNGTILERAANRFTKETVNVFMPKFKIDTSIILKDILAPVGVKLIFDAKAQISGLVMPDANMFVSAAIQKAIITIDEDGVEAAAVVAAVGQAGSGQGMKPPKIYDFKADHPFAYCIKTGQVLIFCGVYYG